MSRGASVFLLVIMGTMWGLQFAMLKRAAQGGYSDLTILMLALVLLSIAFVAIMLGRRQMFQITWPRAKFLLIICVLGYIIPLGATLAASHHLPAGILTLLASFSPVATVIIALLFRTEAVSRLRLAGIGLGTFAVVLVFWPELQLPGAGTAAYMALTLLIPVCYGMESIYIAKYWPEGLNPLQAVTGETVAAMLCVAPVFLIFGSPSELGLNWGGAEIAILLFVLAGVIESLLYFVIIHHTGGVFVSFGTFVSLAAGIAWGMVLFGETHGLPVWAAVVILCAALGLVCFDDPDARRKSGSAPEG
ncbi:MAG: DMT family transporter [Pseudomonadota bacterium]